MIQKDFRDYLTPPKWYNVVLYVIAAAALGAVFLALIASTHATLKWLKTDGVRVTGTIDKKMMGGYNNGTPMIGGRFTTRDGTQTVIFSIEVTDAEYARFAVGQSVALVYDPVVPVTAELQTRIDAWDIAQVEAGNAGRIMLTVLFFAILGPAGWFIEAYHKYRKDTASRTSGLAV